MGRAVTQVWSSGGGLAARLLHALWSRRATNRDNPPIVVGSDQDVAVNNLVVIFGAGASHDSVDVETSTASPSQRPPLTKDLVNGRGSHGASNNSIISRYPDCEGLILQLRGVLATDGANLESWLSGFVEKADQEDLVQLTAFRFYLRDAISESVRRWAGDANGLTNYRHLIDRVDRWRRRSESRRVTFITFNYDTMLEQAIDRHFKQARTDNPDDLISHAYAPVVKLHGSTDWYRDLGRTSPNRSLAVVEMIREVREVEALAACAPIVRHDEIASADNRWLYPAISVPLASKDVFECPASHLDHAWAALVAAERVLVIGWRAADLTFMNQWHYWRNRPSTYRPHQDLTVVAHNESDEVLTRLEACLSPSGSGMSGEALSAGFSDYLRTDQLEQWLG